MSGNETLEERKDYSFNDESNDRKRDWVESKRASIKERNIYKTVLLVMLVIMITLALKITSFTRSFEEEVLQSWQLKSVAFLMFLTALYQIWGTRTFSDSISFVELDERSRFEKNRYNIPPSIFFAGGGEGSSALSAANEELAIINEKSRKAVSGYDFVEHMRSIIESLDFQIDYAEEKASRLLEAGRSFVRNGIWLYVVNIVIWQAYLYYINFSLNAGVIVGMASSTVIFLIMEVLGSWYLKQYRHYGDSAFSYMKVRSSYNKYMLAYCAIVEFTTDDLSKAKEDMLRVLAESEKWPDLKDVNSNDFNYMLQSVESMGTIFEKLRGVFGRTNGSGTPS